MTTAPVMGAAPGDQVDDLPCWGTLTNTRVPDAPVDPDRLRDLLKANGLNDGVVPAKRPEVFDFQKACGSVDTRKGAKDEAGTYVDVRRIKADNDECIYMVVQGEKKPKQRDLEHHNAMRVVYDKQRATDGRYPIVFEPVDPDMAQALMPLQELIKQRFDEFRGKIPGAKIREILRLHFQSLGATRWSSTNSIWFVPHRHKDKVDAMERTLVELYGSDELEFDTIELYKRPGVDDKLERKMATAVKTQAFQLVEQARAALSNGATVEMVTFEQLRNATAELAKTRRQHEEFLDRDLKLADEAQRILEDQIMELWSRVTP